MSRTLRSRTGIGAGATIALCLAALSASAQERPVTTGANRADTVKLRVSGRVNMDYVQRDAALMSITSGTMNTVTGGPENNSFNTVEGEISVRFDAELTEKISAVVEISRQRTDDFGIVPFLGDGGDVDNDFTLREAHLKVMDFLSPGVSMKMGILDWSFDTRGRGSALAFDPHHSQLMSRNMFNAQDTTNLMSGRYGSTNATELEPIGFHLAYTGGQLTIDFVVMPVVQENGPVSQDEALYALDFWYNLEQQVGKGSRVGAILAITNVPDVGALNTGSQDQLITFGAGVNLAFQGGIEVFGEFYAQTGNIGRDATAAATETDAKGNAFMIGGRWTSSAEGKMWVEVSFTRLSGDDDGADEEVNSFMSYESVNDFLIVEDVFFGLDVDTNLTAIKIMGGMSFGMAGGKDNVELQLGVGFFKTTEDVVKSNDAGQEDDALGTEIDAKIKYHLSKQASLNLNFGILTGSDLLEDMGGGSAADTADDSAWLLSLGFDVRY